jgi:hypothetical protein
LRRSPCSIIMRTWPAAWPSMDSRAIGLALDGTGYGTDGKIWGGEVLIARLDGFERFAHLDYVPMPGGEAAIKEPWRMALGHLRAAGFDLSEMMALVGATEKEARVLARMMERGVNAPLTSSLGRLFDAAAAVVLGGAWWTTKRKQPSSLKALPWMSRTISRAMRWSSLVAIGPRASLRGSAPLRCGADWWRICAPG